MPQIKLPPIVSAAPLISRRHALGLFSAQVALSLGACSKPQEEIVPYVRMPEGLTPGDTMRFATALPLGGYGRGVVAISVDGRPIKIEGNKHHPASLGSTDVFAEAAVLSLYDPDRAQTPTKKGKIASWDAFLADLLPAVERFSKRNGEGLRLLTGPITSPTLLRQIDELLTRYPKAAWHAYDPVGPEIEREGARIAFGRPLDLRLRLSEATVVLALDADPLGPGPRQISNARGWIEARNPHAPKTFSRVYAAESCPTITGTKSDHRIALDPRGIADIAVAVANALGADFPDPPLNETARRFASAAAADLRSHLGGAVVIAGPTLHPDVHALVHWINHSLKAPVDYFEPFDRANGREAGTLATLAAELEAGSVDSLITIGANPAYDASQDLRISDGLSKVSFSVSLALHADETAALSRWHIPQCHPLEGWSDIRATDGTVTIVQPLIRPLHASRTDHELIAALAGRVDVSSRDLVRETWRPTRGDDFETWWRQSLSNGVIASTAAEPVSVQPPKLSAPTRGNTSAMIVVGRPDPAVWDGSMANNPWLQECPKPLTKEVWGNAVSIGIRDAENLRIKTGDVLRISVGEHSIEAPARVEAGVADGVIGVFFGYGRTKAGAIGNGIGANAYALRAVNSLWAIEGATIAATGDVREVLTTSNYVRLEGKAEELYPVLALHMLGNQSFPAQTRKNLPSLLPDQDHDTYAWAMSIDTSACIGCNACIIACQAENNGAVVGPEEVARGRDMHWLRVDIYDRGTLEAPEAGFQPVPCMHCEHAPCEPVCPVAASVHDSEGLNVQVYNRCVGTRFCEANCPYKVRRFNFFGYADGQEYANLGAESMKALRNPDVSTRQRGVMEKCTYCVQRISRARREAKKDGRRIAEGDVVTACQSACPTRAINFGDLAQLDSRVSLARKDSRHYELLGHLDTRPRTTYLADVRNPNAAVKRDGT